MKQVKTDLSRFNNPEFKVGKGFVVVTIWYIINAVVFNSYLFPFYGIKTAFLKLFGAKIGTGVLIKPKVNIKYPWKLDIGNHVWIGEMVWIDNLDNVSIGSNACISQGALILSGNHDYTKSTFDLITKPILIEEGVWIGAQAIVTGGVVCKSHSVITAGSIISRDTEAFGIYKGNPAIKIKDRNID